MKLLKLMLIMFLMIFTSHISAKNMTILVHPFLNTGDVKFSWISAGMTSSAISDLERIRDIVVISESDRSKVQDEIELAQTGLITVDDNSIKVGEMLGANYIFTGNYFVVGNHIRVNVSLIDVSKGKTERSIKLDGRVEEIFDLQDRIVLALMAETEKIPIPDIMPVKISEEERKRIENKKKTSISAYELYSKAIEIWDKNPNNAMNYFRLSLEIDPDYADALRDAGWTAGYALDLYNEAFQYFELAEKNFLKSGEKNTTDYSSLLISMGAVYGRKGDLDKALECLLMSKDIYDGLDLSNTEIYSNLLNHIGVICLNKGEIEKALSYYMKSKDTMDGLDLVNTVSYSNLMCNIGVVCGREGKLDKALEYYIESKRIKDRLALQNTIDYSVLMMNIGSIYVSKGELNEAHEYYTSSMKIKDRLCLQNTESYSSLMIGIGSISHYKCDLDNALEYYMKGKEIMDRLSLQNTAKYSDLMSNIGVVYVDKKELDKGLEFYLESKKVKDKLFLQKTVGYSSLMTNIGVVY
nr:tetratricopeptide repeat protein [Spirochaetota bacterium]